MNLQKCANGHYYDGDTYTQCPHCDNTSADSNSTIAMDFNDSGLSDVTVAMGSMEEGVTI